VTINCRHNGDNLQFGLYLTSKYKYKVVVVVSYSGEVPYPYLGLVTVRRMTGLYGFTLVTLFVLVLLANCIIIKTSVNRGCDGILVIFVAFLVTFEDTDSLVQLVRQVCQLWDFWSQAISSFTSRADRCTVCGMQRRRLSCASNSKPSAILRASTPSDIVSLFNVLSQLIAMT
jgi:hypothetical protein